MRNPRGDPIKGTICAIMMVVGFGYFFWVMMSPLNLLFGAQFGQIPPLPLLIVNSAIYIPLIYYTVRYWLRTMMKRKSGPAGGIDTVEPGKAEPEPGDEWGTATRPYRPQKKTKVIGSKSDIRDPQLIDSGFFVKTPDLETGESIFDHKELMKKAMVKSTVSSGGWIEKSSSSRGVGTLKSKETTQHGRPIRSRRPSGEVGSIDIMATLMAAITRSGRKGTEDVRIREEDIRERVYSGRTPLTIILVIDVSMSMKKAIGQVRKVIERIERETRGSKDRIGIVAFKDSGAVEVQAPTTNWNKVYRALARLKISGLTPLAESLMKSLEVIRRERMRAKNVEPLVIVVSDFAPNIPLAQTVGPGHAQYTPVKDLVKASRLIRKADVRLVTINCDLSQRNWVKFLKRPYHDALELATMLRMRKEGYTDPIETILAVPEFRQSFGAYLIARAARGRAYLSDEVLKSPSVLGEFLAGSTRRTKIRRKDLKEVEAYLPV